MNLLAVLVAFVICYIIFKLKRNGLSFMYRILIATFMGAVVGLIFKGHTDYLGAFGRI